MTIRDVTIRASAAHATGIGLCSPYGLHLEGVTFDIEPLSGFGACSGAGIERRWECSQPGVDQDPFIQMEDVSIRVANDKCSNIGVHPGETVSLVMRDSSVVVEGHSSSLGIRLWWGSGELINVKVVAPLALVGSMSVRSSEIRGELRAFQTGRIAISHSHLEGRVSRGAAACFAVCDDAMNHLDEDCQVGIR